MFIHRCHIIPLIPYESHSFSYFLSYDMPKNLMVTPIYKSEYIILTFRFFQSFFENRNQMGNEKRIVLVYDCHIEWMTLKVLNDLEIV